MSCSPPKSYTTSPRALHVPNASRNEPANSRIDLFSIIISSNREHCQRCLGKGAAVKDEITEHIVDEIEHIGDVVSKNLMIIAEKKIENNYYFSEQGFKDIKMMYEEVKKTFNRTIGLMTMFDEDEAESILKRRKQILNVLNELHIKHLVRMQKSVKESIETSTLHLDILNDYERINFHSCKIGYYLAENKNKFGGQK